MLAETGWVSGGPHELSPLACSSFGTNWQEPEPWGAPFRTKLKSSLPSHAGAGISPKECYGDLPEPNASTLCLLRRSTDGVRRATHPGTRAPPAPRTSPLSGARTQFNLDDDALEDLRAALKVGEVEAGTVELAEAD